MSRRVKCQEEIAKFLTLLEDDSDCEQSDPYSDGKFYFMDVNEMCAYNNFLYMAAVIVYSFSSTASKHNQCISDIWSAVTLVRGYITSMQVEMSFSVLLLGKTNTVNIIVFP